PGGAGERGSDVGEHVAEQIVGDDHVELLGPAHQLHGAGICKLMLEGDVLELAAMQLVDDLVPEHACLHDIALLHGRDLVAPPAREVERNSSAALDLVGLIHLCVDGALLAVAQVSNGLRLPEIDAARELTQNDDVETVEYVALETR